MGTYGLDLSEAARVLRGEIYGDWYRDPWGWPEFGADFISKVEIDSCGVGRLGGGAIGMAKPIVFEVLDVPKSKLGTRPAVIQDPASRLAYTAAAMAIGKVRHPSLPDWVYGWRFREGQFAKSTEEWDRYSSAWQEEGVRSHSLQTDITSFFASIPIETFIGDLRSSVGRIAAVQIVEDTLNAHSNVTGRRGFPQRSTASAVLANVALRQVDDAIELAMHQGRIVTARRWMDDISASGSEDELFRLLHEIQTSSRSAGVEINSAKTSISIELNAKQSFVRANRRKVPVKDLQTILRSDYVDDEYQPIDATELMELEGSILDDPDSSQRTVGTAVLRSLREHEMFDRFDQWLEYANHLPHLADKLGRYFGSACEVDPKRWRPLEAWFSEYVSSPWGNLQWTQAQFALSFPSTHTSESISQIQFDWLENSNDLQQVAVAVQRLSNSEKSTFRSVAHKRSVGEQNPMVARVLALGMHGADGDQTEVRRMLSRHSACALTLDYLESTSWRLPSVPADFDRLES